MKNFNTYVNEDIENPYNQYGRGSGLLGPGMGQYDPIADLNAQSEKEVKKSDLDQIEKYADRLFASLDIDVEFTRHFLDRVNDERNVKQITPSELTRLFKQTYKKHGKTIARLGPDAQAVLTDMKTDINMPFVLNLKGGELELVAKTVMRKKDFKTSNPKLAFESVSDIFKAIKLLAKFYKTRKDEDAFKAIKFGWSYIKNPKIRKSIVFLVKYIASKYGHNDWKGTVEYIKKNTGVDISDYEQDWKRVKGGYTFTTFVPEGTYFTRTRSNKSRGQIMKKQLRPKIEPLMKDIGFKRGSYKMEPNASANNLIITVNKSDLDRVKKALKPLGLPNIVQVVSEGRKTIKVGEDAVLGDGSPHYALVSDREVIATGTKEEMLELNLKVHGRVWLTKSNVGDIVEQSNPRIPRKKGQPAKSKKHSDLYTDEDPVGTIHGLGFKDVETARASVKKIENSDRTHAHKIQAAVAMEQRAKEMGKSAEANIYRTYINKMKKKTKEMQKEDAEDDKLQKVIKVATAKTDLAKKLKQIRNQQKITLGNIRDPDQKKLRRDAFKKQIQVTKNSGKREIKQIQKEELMNEQPEHEITVGNYTTKHFFMCGSAQTVMKKHADKDGAEELTRMQDLFYKMEHDAMLAGGASDEQKKKSQILYDKIITKAKQVGIENEVDKYMKMHLDSMLKNNPKLGFGRTDKKESYQEMISRLMSRYK